MPSRRDSLNSKVQKDIIVVYPEFSNSETYDDAKKFVNEEISWYEKIGFERTKDIKDFVDSLNSEGENDSLKLLVFEANDDIGGTEKLALTYIADQLKDGVKSQNHVVVILFNMDGKTPISYREDDMDDAFSFFLSKDNVVELSVSDAQKQSNNLFKSPVDV